MSTYDREDNAQVANLPAIQYGDPVALAAVIDGIAARPDMDAVTSGIVPAVEQLVAHYRAAGWSDLAIGAALTRAVMPDDVSLTAMAVAVAVARRCV